MILLRALDDDGIERLLDLAVADADPADVMPPGWTPDQADAFRAFYRDLRPDAHEVVRDGRTVGMARLTAAGETGMWIARHARGGGIGLAALRHVVSAAARRGITAVVADTTTDNVAALTVLRKAGAVLTVDGDRVTARLAVPTEPSPDIADPRVLLSEYLDHYRDAALRKIDGMSEQELRTSRLPTGWTPLAMVKHLAHVELRWLRWCFRGEEIARPHGNPDVERAEWVVEDSDTTDGIREFYLEQCGHARRIAAESALTDRAVRWNRTGVPRPTLAWILFHLLQEYARHVGHLDIARELSDGATGE